MPEILTELTTEEREEHERRFKLFRACGFGEDDSHLLAASEATLEQTHTLLETGCSHWVALQILA